MNKLFYSRTIFTESDDTFIPCSTSNKWTCFNRNCVFNDDHCNGYDDCGDDSDESYAHARCTAHDAPGRANVKACDFKANTACRFDGIGHGWVVDRGSRTLHRGPQVDHTIGRVNGS